MTSSVPWYPARLLEPKRHSDRRLHLAGAGWQIVGKLGRYGPTQMWAWLEWRPAISEFVLLSPWRRLELTDVPGRREPDLWRPIEGEAWPDPLPEPVSSPKPMAVVTCRSTTEDEPTPDAVRRAAYSAAGEISRDEVETRVLRALKTIRVQPSAMPKGWLGAVAWPAILVEWSDLVGRELKDPDHAPPPRFVPTRRDLDDMLTALGWFSRLKEAGGDRRLNEKQRLILWRALDPPYSWRAIGDRLKVSHEQARAMYGQALDRILGIANGRDVAGKARQARRSVDGSSGDWARGSRARPAHGHR